MTHTRLFQDCHLVSPGVDLEGASVLVKDGLVARIFPYGDALPKADEVTYVSGNYLMPGFLDVHCHGNGGVDFSDALPGGMDLLTYNKLCEGVTTFLPTTLTLPEDDLRAALRTAEAYRADGEKNCRVPGVHLEGPFLNPARLGAQNPAFVRKPDIREVRRLQKIYPVLKLSYAPELPGGAEFAARLLAEGILPSCVHSSATYADFLAAKEHGLRNISHFCNQSSALHHREIGVVGAGFAEEDVSVEVICDGFHLCPDMVRLIFSLKGCEKIQLVTDAMRAAGLPDGKSSIGGLDVIVKDGIARLASNGALAGSTLTMNAALRNACEFTGCELSDLVRTTSWNQAQELGLEKTGKIEPGFFADLVILDGNLDVEETIVGGETRYQRGA